MDLVLGLGYEIPNLNVPKRKKIITFLNQFFVNIYICDCMTSNLYSLLHCLVLDVVRLSFIIQSTIMLEFVDLTILIYCTLQFNYTLPCLSFTIHRFLIYIYFFFQKEKEDDKPTPATKH